MNLLLAFALFTVCVITQVKCQPNAYNEELSEYFEYLDPRWRRHRARLVPWAFDTPIVQPIYRTQRSLAESDENMVNCQYSDATIKCSINGEKNVECLAKLNITDSLLQKFSDYGISQTLDNGVLNKFVLLPKLTPDLKRKEQDIVRDFKRQNKDLTVSIHSNKVNTDQGIQVEDKLCWLRLANMITTATKTKQVTVQKINQNKNDKNNSAKIIGNLNVILNEDKYLSLSDLQ